MRRLAKAVLAGEQLIELQSEAVEWRLPPVVIWHHEAQIMHQMRRVLQKQSALLECLHDQSDIALFQVTNAAVSQLGAATGRAFAEVALL